MLSKVLSYALSGVDGFPVTVETFVSAGLFSYDTVGLPDTAVKESRELAEVFRTIADIIEQKILPADWRCADAESEENDAQPDGNPA